MSASLLNRRKKKKKSTASVYSLLTSHLLCEMERENKVKLYRAVNCRQNEKSKHNFKFAQKSVKMGRRKMFG